MELATLEWPGAGNRRVPELLPVLRTFPDDARHAVGLVRPVPACGNAPDLRLAAPTAQAGAVARRAGRIADHRCIDVHRDDRHEEPAGICRLAFRGRESAAVCS